MKADEFLIKISNVEELKVSIWLRVINNQTYYYARYINTQIQYYQDLTEEEKKNNYGINYTESTNGPIVYYNDRNEFKKDLIFALPAGPRLKSQLS